jgi:hypothetical protein
MYGFHCCRFSYLIIVEPRYMAIFYTQLHPDRSRNVTAAVEIRVRIYVKWGCPCADFHWTLAWEPYLRNSCFEFHEKPTDSVVTDTTTRTAISVDGRTWFSHKTFFFVYFVMDAYNVLSALKEFCFVAHSCSCILPTLDHAEKCLNIQVTDLYRQWYFSLYSF